MIAAQEIEFYLYDHLGNTRVVYEPTYAGGVLELAINYAADYFPYGKVLREYVNTNSGDPEKFLTTQHERDKETGLDYRGARYYDADIARFLSLDPLAKEFPAWSAYNYVFSNPVIFTDPTGKSPNPPDWYENQQGDIRYLEGETADQFWTDQASYDENGEFSHVTTFTWNKINYTPNQEEAQSEKILPEMIWDSNFGVALGQGMVQAAAEASATEFKYIEAPGIPKNSHIAPLNQISKTVGTFGNFYTIADKGVATTNAIIDGQYEKAAKEGTLLTGYTLAAYMMAAPTGVTQIVGGAMFLVIGIYDLFDD